MRKKGFIDCQRMIGLDTGECTILSTWESEEDCQASMKDDSYYLAGLGMLRECARYGMFKTEHFAFWTLRLDEARQSFTTASEVEATTGFSPYARMSTIIMNDEEGTAEAIDGFLQH